MNLVDYILIAIVGLSMVLSLWRGFVREVISVIGLALAFLVASRFSGHAGDYLGQWISSTTVADIAGFGLLFIIVMIVVGLVGALIRRLVDLAELTATDRTLGIFFGAARGILLIAVTFLIFTTYNPKANDPILQGSRLTPYAIELGDMLGHLIPEGYPFSRQGGGDKPATLNANDNIRDIISTSDRQALDALIENSSK